MTEIDLDRLRAFVGRQETRTDTVREDALDQFRGTLEGHLCSPAIAPVPPGFHWTLFPPLTPVSALREDGHPVAIGVLPEMPLPARMWAGGAVDVLGTLNPGDPVERRSRLAGIDLKSGRSGPLLFASIEHEVLRGGELVVRETQTIVYRDPAPASPAPAVPSAPPDAPAGGGFIADSRLLFRYSALTFNTHRIHYDAPYAREVERYPGLVVHGPLQATLLMNAVARQLGHARFQFSYRGLAPLMAGQRALLCVDPDAAGEPDQHGASGEARLERGPGDATMTARYTAGARASAGR